ncbi:MAG: deoxynucleoside kinase, partial [Owenweeksia sp.]
MSPAYICIEGNIGSGKTTLARLLSEEMNARLILEEFEDNPFLAGFYEDPIRYSFPLEMSFLADRYHQLKQKLSEPDLFQPLVVSDYTLLKSLIFARINLKEMEYRLYRDFFAIIERQLPKPDLIVFINRSLDAAKRNIVSRGRDYEQNIQHDYLKNIHEGYQTALKGL